MPPSNVFHRKATSIVPKTAKAKKFGSYQSPFGDPYTHQKLSESRKIQQLHSSSDFAESEVSDCDSAYNIPVNTHKPKIPKLKIKKLKSG